MRHFRRGAAAAIFLVLPGVARADEPTPPSADGSRARQAALVGQDDQDLARLSLG